MNTWPNGKRRAMLQSEHESWNSCHYPGTRQLCSRCEQPTGRCEDDSLYNGDEGPVCEQCWLPPSDELPESRPRGDEDAEEDSTRRRGRARDNEERKR